MFSNAELNFLIITITEQEPNLVSIIKHFTKTYTFKSNKELKKAFKQWCENKNECIQKYGHISHWDVSKITDMSNLFSYYYIDQYTYLFAEFNEDISRWDVSQVINMKCMFSESENFNQPLNDWDVSNVTNMDSMFMFAKCFNQPLNNWNVSNVTNMCRMFNNAKTFNQPLNNWNVSNVKDMGYMFYKAKKFNQPLNNWSVFNVTSMIAMFSKAYDFYNISGIPSNLITIKKWDYSSIKSILHQQLFIEDYIVRSQPPLFE